MPPNSRRRKYAEQLEAGYGDDKENGDDELDYGDEKEDRDDGYEDDDVKASAKTSADANASNTNRISIRNSNTLSFDDIVAIFT